MVFIPLQLILEWGKKEAVKARWFVFSLAKIFSHFLMLVSEGGTGNFVSFDLLLKRRIGVKRRWIKSEKVCSLAEVLFEVQE